MKRKIVSLILVFIIVLISLTGCDKKSITVDDFDKVLNAKEYTVEENNEYYDTFIDIIDGRKVNSDKWEMEFFVLSGNKDAELMFEKDRNMIEVYKGNVVKLELQNTLSNYEMYEIVASGHFGYACRINNTVLFVKAEEQYKDEIKAIIEELGY